VLEELALHCYDIKTHTNFFGKISQARLVRGREEKKGREKEEKRRRGEGERGRKGEVVESEAPLRRRGWGWVL